MESAWASWLTLRFDAYIKDGDTLFYDTSELMSFGAQFQAHMMPWMLKNRSRLRAAHVLTIKPMVRMAVSVANIKLQGWITTHSDLTTFKAAMLAAQ